MSPRLRAVQSVIGHDFANPALLQRALTHSSVNHHSGRKDTPDNERLEFLGDAVLQLTLSEWLYESMPEADEGALTKRRALLVSTRALARLARRMELGTHLEIGRGEDAQGGRGKDNILADAVEAVLGAVYLDGGLDAAREFVRRHFSQGAEHEAEDERETNPKGSLQEICQAFGPVNLRYEIAHESGPDHAKFFTAIVLWDEEALGSGEGRSKREAETRAAHAALHGEALKASLERRGKPILNPP